MALLDIFLFAIIAIYIGYRLWSVLGTYNPDKPIKYRQPDEIEDVVKPVRVATPSNNNETQQEQRSSPQQIKIDKERFLKGAQKAFHQIIEGYVKEDCSTLEKLLDRPVYESFVDAIQKRQKKKQVLDIDLTRILSSEVIAERHEKETVYFTVKFVSEQCIVTKDKKNKIISGDPNHYTAITDIWTFAREINSPNPNWKLVATQLSEDSENS